MIDTLRIVGFEAKDGFYLSRSGAGGHTFFTGQYLFDGEKPQETFHSQWFKLKKRPTLVQYVQPNSPKITFVLKNQKLFPNLQKKYSKKEVWDKDLNDFKPSFKDILSLYQSEKEEVSPTLKTIKLELEYLGEFKEDIPSKEWRLDRPNYLANRTIQHRLIDEITKPSILLPSRPCHLSSKDTYQIIRDHVKVHLDRRFAYISSDYDFCFAVEKLVTLDKPIREKIYTTSSKQTKKVTRKQRKIKSFEMTWDPKCYKDYTPIEPFTGKNEEELLHNIQIYLDNLMAELNRPLKDCPHCQGYGVIDVE